ncbi:hypothetical protein TWF481_001393 [Arthrobotrys musiformis]|uniref:Fucose-specific lectin n=1 Tax=Arthrobotrys musiformis TaxID=47236 RepID=A0AAV9WRB0_9PEZI
MVFLSQYAVVVTGRGNWLMLYFQRPSGAIWEGRWAKKHNTTPTASDETWFFREVVAAEDVASKSPIAAVMFPDDDIRVFYVNPQMVIHDIRIKEDAVIPGEFGALKIKLEEDCFMTAGALNWNAASVGIYLPGRDGRFKNYLKRATWDPFGPFPASFQINRTSPVSYTNPHPWKWQSPAVRVFHTTPSHEINCLSWNNNPTGWHIMPEKPPFPASSTSRFAVASQSTRGKDRDHVTAAETLMLFVADVGNLEWSRKIGERKWTSVGELGSVRYGTFIAAGCARDSDGGEDVHVFTAGLEQSTNFVHRFLRGGVWEQREVVPFIEGEPDVEVDDE